MYFAVYATDRPNSLLLRLQTRPSHRDYMRDMTAHPEVAVLRGGPTLAADGETMNGTLLIVEAPTLAAAEAFAAGDPYQKANLFTSAYVRPWAWTIGRPD